MTPVVNYKIPAYNYNFGLQLKPAPGNETRISFLICYLQLLYKIEPGHCFCPEFGRYITN